MNNAYYFFYTGPFSQFYGCEFKEGNITYHFTEQYMMAKKAELFGDLETLLDILNCKVPTVIKKLGRQIKNFNQEIWDEKKLDIVIRGNYLKFSQNPDLLKQLINTGDRLIVEASPTDCIWGIGLSDEDPARFNDVNWRGTNLLGIALTKVRDMLILENENLLNFNQEYDKCINVLKKCKNNFDIVWNEKILRRQGKHTDKCLYTANNIRPDCTNLTNEQLDDMIEYLNKEMNNLYITITEKFYTKFKELTE